jgi:hypothetical protein
MGRLITEKDVQENGSAAATPAMEQVIHREPSPIVDGTEGGASDEVRAKRMALGPGNRLSRQSVGCLKRIM